MSLSTFLAVLRRRRAWLVVAVLAGVLLAWGNAATTTRTYTATAGVFFSLEFGNSANDLAQGSTYTQNQVSSYALLARTATVLRPVIAEEGLESSPRVLAAQVSTEVIADTVVVEVSATDSSPARAARIANAVAEQLGATVEDLAPVNADGRATVRATTVSPATEPRAPVSPRTTLEVVLGLLGGLLVGVLAAVLRDVTDTRVRTAEDLASVTTLPLLASLDTAPSGTGARALVVNAAPQSNRAEAFRALRTSVQFLAQPDRTLSLLVTSARPGDGKSTVAANLALALAESGLRVALVDADLRRPSIADTFDLEGAAGLTTVLIGQAGLDDVLQEWGSAGLHVLTSGPLPPNPSELLASPAMAAVLAELEAAHDVVVIDTAPLLPVTDGVVLSRVVSGTLVVGHARRTRRAVLREALTLLQRVDARVVGVVLSHVRQRDEDTYGYGAAEGPPRLEAVPVVPVTVPGPATGEGVPGASGTMSR